MGSGPLVEFGSVFGGGGDQHRAKSGVTGFRLPDFFTVRDAPRRWITSSIAPRERLRT